MARSGRTQVEAAMAPLHRLGPGEIGDDLGQDAARGCSPHRRPSCRYGRRRTRPSWDRTRSWPASMRGEARPTCRKPSIACCGAPTRGPFFSSRVSGERAGRPVTVSARRRGVDEGAWRPHRPGPASTSALVTAFFRSSAARRWKRAGISSEKSSSRSSGMKGTSKTKAGIA